MATRVINFHTLICDGCEKTFGTTTQYSIIEARAAAYGAGWRFPERVRATVGESKTVNDVCPSCAPDWKPQAARNNHIRRRTT